MTKAKICPYCDTQNVYRPEHPWCMGCGAPVHEAKEETTYDDYIVTLDSASGWLDVNNCIAIIEDNGNIYIGGSFT